MQLLQGPALRRLPRGDAVPAADDMAIHQFDLARELIGTEPVVGLLRVLQPQLELVRRRRGRRGGCRVRGRHPVHVSPAAGAVLVWRPPGTAAGGSARLEAQRAGTVTTHRSPRTPTASRSPPNRDGPEQIAGSLAEFVTALRTGAAPSGEAHSNVLSLAMVEAAIKSAQTGGGWSSPTCSTTPTPRRCVRAATRAGGGAGVLAVRCTTWSATRAERYPPVS